jgi:diguanylate cyclase (GGDEF)-like protein
VVEPPDRSSANEVKAAPDRWVCGDNGPVPILELASQVMTLAQDGGAEEALRLGRDATTDLGDEPPLEAAALWYAIAVAEHSLGRLPQQIEAADRCLAVARAHGSPGWASNALSIRAMALARRGAVERALTDLAVAEAELGECDDLGLASWAHTGLGYCYDQMRLYELAQPHFEAALVDGSSPMPLAEEPVIDLLNLAEMHLRWADELERVVPTHASERDVEQQHQRGVSWSRAALEMAAKIGVEGYHDASRRLDLCLRAETEPAVAVPELRAALEDPAANLPTTRAGGRAQVATALARALRKLDDLDAAVAAAQLAVEAAQGPGDWQVMAAAAHLLVDLQAEQGLPGALAGREYGRLLSSVLWAQRLHTLQGARTALDVERLQRARETAERAAREDPLTGLGNRRALEEALARLRAPSTFGGRASDAVVHSLLLFDVDGFKAVNDSYGHLVGDDVLRAVAEALSGRARCDDVLVRLGGDEFVVLAPGATAEAARDLVNRMRAGLEAVDLTSLAPGLELRVSIGVATTGRTTRLEDLVGAADAAMYASKHDAPRLVEPEGDAGSHHGGPRGGSLAG